MFALPMMWIQQTHTHCGRQQDAKQEANNESIAFAFYRNFAVTSVRFQLSQLE